MDVGTERKVRFVNTRLLYDERMILDVWPALLGEKCHFGRKGICVVLIKVEML